MGSIQQSLDSKSNALSAALPRKICELGFTFVNTVVCIAIIWPQYYTSFQNRAVDKLHKACTFIKTENIAVNEIGRIICSHILLHAQ